MFILGINAYEITSSAAFILDGKVVFAVAEERFTRIKRHKCFPSRSIQEGFDFLKIGIEDIDAIAIGWNPAVEAYKVNGVLGNRPRELLYFKIVEAFMSISSLREDDTDWTMLRNSGKSVPDIYFVRHHLAHASNAAFQSPFESGDVLTLDFMGERQTGCFGNFENCSMSIHNYSKQPSSTGGFYAAITELIGYKYDSDEWKVMALSGLPCNEEKVANYIEVFKESILERGIAPFLKNQYYNCDQPREKFLTTSELRKELDYPGQSEFKNPSNNLKSWQVNVAVAMQRFIYEYTFKAIEKISSRLGSNRNVLCLSGGFFMNCVFNGKLERSNLYKKIYISQTPADIGNSIGSALYLYHHILGKKRFPSHKTSLFTGNYIEKDVESILDNFRLNYKKYDDPKKIIAEIISALEVDSVIGICDSRSEFGERALGARSIIAMPTSKDMKQLINSKIKYRESYRPFAPVCLQNDATKYFEVQSDYECDAMQKTVNVRPEFISSLEAITHDDGSARLQTIDNEDRSIIAEVLRTLRKKGSLPVLINTSFNLNGEPNVESAIDAIRTFYSSGLDLLVFSPSFVVTK